ncbi:MAG TPA: L,D-transpeptidase [Pirellulaceae bacterium]|nr:L,D-transpeptidase [Pirellulaceae bacterium]
MNTLKSAALVVILTGVLVGVYVTVYKPPVTPPPGMSQQDLDDLGPPLIEDDAQSDDPAASSGWEHDAAHDQTPLAAGESHLGGSSVIPPAASDLEDRNPADPLASPVARSLSHSEPLIEQQSIYSSPPPGETDSAAASPAASYDAAAVAGRLAQHNFRRDFDTARRQIDEGEFRAALATLSPHYGQSDLTPQQHGELVAWLDALAAKVIYSREHLLAQPYKVRGSNERMIDVARKCGVTAHLLQNINASAVNNPEVLLAGTVLKVVPGPFRAEVSLARGEITVFLNELYAGRFPMALGDEPVVPGQYQVQQKQHMPTYVGSDGRTVAGNDPANPYGAFSLNLNSHVRIHGSPLIAPAGRPRGCIGLSPKDAEDLYGILTEGSIVVIK